MNTTQLVRIRVTPPEVTPEGSMTSTAIGQILVVASSKYSRTRIGMGLRPVTFEEAARLRADGRFSEGDIVLVGTPDDPTFMTPGDETLVPFMGWSQGEVPVELEADEHGPGEVISVEMVPAGLPPGCVIHLMAAPLEVS